MQSTTKNDECCAVIDALAVVLGNPMNKENLKVEDETVRLKILNLINQPVGGKLILLK